jgi:ubiquinol-cytochrome c reductase cytochrome b subunit
MKIINNIIDWLDERTGLKQPIIDIATHLVPPGAKWSYVFGTAVLTSFIVQLVTGIALATIYVPSAGDAYESIRYISYQALFGKLLRGMHYFGASSMILFAGIHMMRVYLTASYKFPRELNWLTGVILLFFTIAMGFTGQVLRWDQTAVWTIAVGAEQALRMPFIGKLLASIILSGDTIGGATLSHFFALHVFIFPGILIGMIGFHLYLVLHNGISEPPVEGDPVDPKTYKEKYESMLKLIGKPFWPDAAWRDIMFSTFVVLCIFALALFIGPPQIEKPPDPSIIQAQPRPDWYLLWYFAILALLPHKAEDWVIILFPMFLGLSLLAVPFLSNRGERSLRRRPWAVGIVVFVIASIGALWHAGVKEAWTPDFSAKPLTAEIIGANKGQIYDGASVFNDRGCLYCHAIAGHGGKRGPDLTDVSDRLTRDQIIIKIINGGYNMPAYAGNITPKELGDLTVFLESRKNK